MNIVDYIGSFFKQKKSQLKKEDLFSNDHFHFNCPEHNINNLKQPLGVITIGEKGIEYKSLNEWQLCPKCSGSGFVSSLNGTVYTSMETCDVCDGKKIISKQTGLPPV